MRLETSTGEEIVNAVALVLGAHVGVVAEEVSKLTFVVEDTKRINELVEGLTFPVVEVSLISLIFTVPAVAFTIDDIHIAANDHTVSRVLYNFVQLGIEFPAVLNGTLDTWIGVWNVNVIKGEIRINNSSFKEVAT